MEILEEEKRLKKNTLDKKILEIRGDYERLIQEMRLSHEEILDNFEK